LDDVDEPIGDTHTSAMRRRGLATMMMMWLVGCASTTPTEIAPIVDRLERAHGMAAWKSKQALTADFTLVQADQVTLSGKMTRATNDDRARFDLDNGAVYVFDGHRAWVSPRTAPLNRARFHLITWPFFVGLPFDLKDRGSNVTDAGVLPLGGRSLRVISATFPGREDWTMLYPDPEHGRLCAILYSFDFDPHTLILSDTETIDGVRLPTRWTFFKWDRASGVVGDPVGRATLRNMKFTRVSDDYFNPPPDAREDLPPAPRPAARDVSRALRPLDGEPRD
jgi:hypothetical protein